ncbi:MAG: mandelate racemase [Acidobacteria bacterium]|nr:mandelate racemase [Acidobacteriota bacterium]
MQRRAFLGSLFAPFAAWAQGKTLSIADLEIWRLEGSEPGVSGVNRQYQVRPLNVYDDQRPAPYMEPAEGRPGPQARTARYLVIKTKEGAEGLYGPIDEEAAVVVDRQLKPFLIGKNALAVETLWDQLYRLNRHSRAGHYMMAVSAVDNALWDLRGRYFDAPVYQLLGGPTRPAATVYGSTLGYSVEPGKAGPRAAELAAKGFRHQKWFIPYGPGDGAAGLRKNIALVEELRAAVGPDVDLMFDAFMGWDLNYAMEWCRAVEHLRVRWIEEAFQVDKMESFRQLARETTIPVATGEHFYGRWEVKRFLEVEAISVVQADPEWCGGVSELVKICALGSSFDAHVIPHGHNIHAALHVVSSQSPMTCPLVEFLILKMASYYYFDKHPPVPADGKLELLSRPGFGMELDEAKIDKRTLLTWA